MTLRPNLYHTQDIRNSFGLATNFIGMKLNGREKKGLKVRLYCDHFPNTFNPLIWVYLKANAHINSQFDDQSNRFAYNPWVLSSRFAMFVHTLHTLHISTKFLVCIRNLSEWKRFSLILDIGLDTNWKSIC